MLLGIMVTASFFSIFLRRVYGTDAPCHLIDAENASNNLTHSIELLYRIPNVRQNSLGSCLAEAFLALDSKTDEFEDGLTRMHSILHSKQVPLDNLSKLCWMLLEEIGMTRIGKGIRVVPVELICFHAKDKVSRIGLNNRAALNLTSLEGMLEENRVKPDHLLIFFNVKTDIAWINWYSFILSKLHDLKKLHGLV